jgi:hypothetical protein
MPCEKCGSDSPWGYAEKKMELDCSPGDEVPEFLYHQN